MGIGVAGYNADLFITGTSTSMTDEACTEVSGTVFQITSAAKRILDDDVAVVVKVDAVTEPSANYTVDYNTGTVTFDASETGNTVTVTANYLPTHQIARLRLMTPSLSYDVLDSSITGDSAESIDLGLLRVAFDVEAVQMLDVDTISTTSIDEVFMNGTRKVLEYRPDGTSSHYLRVRVQATQLTQSNNGAGGLAQASISFQGDQKHPDGSTTFLSYAAA